LEHNNLLKEEGAVLEQQLEDAKSNYTTSKSNGDTSGMEQWQKQIKDISKLISENRNALSHSSSTLSGMESQMEGMTGGADATVAMIDTIVHGIDDSIQATKELFYEIKELADSFGWVDENSAGWQTSSTIMDSLSEMSSNVSGSWDSFKNGDFMGATVKAFGAISSVIKGVNKIHDQKYERKIVKQQEKIEELSRTYDKLKEHMDAAWDISKLESYYDQTVDNLEAQITSYKAMIRAEEDKKKTDDDKIKEWKQSIEDIEDQIAELKESYTESLGGFGSEENYQSAAQAFADAWVDAFNEGESTLDALNDTFNDYFDNLLKKQLMLRASTKYIQPILDAFDEAVADESESGNKVTKNELDRIKALKDKNLEAYNEYATALMEAFGETPENSSELSALQQGISSLSEETGSALEALLNSIRFFVATEQGDISIIRAILENQFPVSTLTTSQSQTNTEEQSVSDSPLLIELRAQTMLIRGINGLLESVCCYNNNSSGRGIRVYMK